MIIKMSLIDSYGRYMLIFNLSSHGLYTMKSLHSNVMLLWDMGHSINKEKNIEITIAPEAALYRLYTSLLQLYRN